MKVKCIYNKEINLPKDIFVKGPVYSESSTFPLKIGKEYTVYGITIKNGYAWYYLVDEYNTYYPRWKPCPLFDVVDGRISRYWIFSYEKGINYIEASAVWAYPEWSK